MTSEEKREKGTGIFSHTYGYDAADRVTLVTSPPVPVDGDLNTLASPLTQRQKRG